MNSFLSISIRVRFFILCSILIYKSVSSQENVIRINCDFDLEFINHIVPCRDLSDDGFNEERQQFKIKSITRMVEGKLLDSLYTADPNNFKLYTSFQSWDHTNYAYNEIYEFDTYGILKSCLVFPVSFHLTKEDSLKQNRKHYTYKQEMDSVTSSLYDSVKLIKRSVYYKGKLSYVNELLSDQIWVKDSINNGWINKIVGFNIYTRKYYYLPDGRLDYITFKGKPLYKYRYFSKDKTEITYFDSVTYSIEGHIDTLQNLIIKDGSGRLIKSIYYTKGEKTFRKIYSVFRDSHGEVNKVERRDEAKDFDPGTELLYDCENTYHGLRIVKTEGSFPFKYNYFSKISMMYNEKGLLDMMSTKSIDNKPLHGHHVVIMYSFY